MLDQMAHRYGMLPSQVLAVATTQDVYVYDVHVSYHNYLQEKQNRKSGAPSQQAPPDSEALAAGLAKFREKTVR